MPHFMPHWAASTALLLISQSAAAAPTLADYIVKLQTSGPGRIVEYCAQQSPATRNELASEFQAFRTKLAEAAAPLIAQLHEAIPEDKQKEMDRFVDTLGEQQLGAAKQFEPNAYCTWLVGSLRASTVERLRKTIQQAFDRYTENERQMPLEGGGR